MRSPTAEEVRRLLSAAQGDRDARVLAFVRLVAATGMRRGEACALRWSDVDWDGSAVTVDEALVTDGGRVRVRGPKTRASVRAVAIDKGTLTVLHLLHDHQKSFANLAEDEVVEDSFVFSYEPGSRIPPYPETLSHAFSAVRRRAGVPADVYLHSLQHFQSTELDRVISSRRSRLVWGGPRCTWPAITPEWCLVRNGERPSTWQRCSADLQGGMEGGEGPAAGGRSLPGDFPVQESLHGPAGDPSATVDGDHQCATLQQGAPTPD
ncbi:MAG: site-specific integrase [Acidimicrobiales bacterium]